MAEAENVAVAQQSDTSWPFPKDRDWFLARLVAIANGGSFEIGLTLTVGGSIVTGTLIGASKYMDAMADQFRQASMSGSSTEEGRDVLVDFVLFWKQVYDRPEDADEDFDPGPPAYIHLRNAKIFSPQGIIPTRQGVLWRGRMKAVGSFSLGEMKLD